MIRLIALIFFGLASLANAQVGMGGMFPGPGMVHSTGGGGFSCAYTPITTGTQGVLYTGATPVPSGGVPTYTYSNTGSLPTGITINSTTGILSGTPSVNGSFPSIQVIATDSTLATANCGSSFTLVISPSGGTPPTIDGHVIGAAGDFGGSATTNITLTTTSTNDLIVVVVSCEDTATPHATVSSVTATGLTFTKRSSVYNDNVSGAFGTTWNTLEVWSAPSTAIQTAKVITVTVSKTIDTGVVGAFGVKINGTNIPTWTSNSPLTVASTATSSPTVGSVASNKAALLVGFTATAEINNQTIGSGFTMIDTNNNPNGGVAMALGEEYKSFSAATSGQTVAFGTSWQTWQIIADAIEGL